jgi:Domain of unknown function (DUF4173)
MADSTAPTSGAGAAEKTTFPIKPAIAVALAALADWLFYGHPVGITAAIFAAAVACGSLLANRPSSGSPLTPLAGALLLAALAPAIEQFNLASFSFLVLALGVGLSLTTDCGRQGLGERAAALRDLYLLGPSRFLREAADAFRLPGRTGVLAVWFVPVLAGGIFLFLLVSANPLLERWLVSMSPGHTASYASLKRSLFWFVALSAIWPFIYVRWRIKRETARSVEAVTSKPEMSPDRLDFFGVRTILRSLMLFNVAYLWGNVKLPDDMSYAEYAHRGAYPLMLTALLAAGFVLAAMRPGGPAEQSGVVRPLVYLWVAQNVLLVASSILRLGLYVEVYLLTWWRVAAFVWMLLVACGLLLIVARIALNRSNGWLIGANLIAVTATLYICSLINFAALIADYNVSHSREAAGKGVEIDTYYLANLGPHALPAIDKAIALRGYDPDLVRRRDWLVQQHRMEMASWRAWGFRNWRLLRALDADPKHSTND